MFLFSAETSIKYEKAELTARNKSNRNGKIAR
jgi:hypothetical protein